MNEHEFRAIIQIKNALRSIQEDIGSIRDQQERNNEDAEPPTPPVILTELQIPERIERSNQANSDREYRLQVCLTVGTWLAFFAAAVYAGIAYQQKATMDATFREVRKQTESSKIAANAAKDAAETTAKALTASAITSHYELRPYVSAISMTLSGEVIEGKTLQVSIRLVNTGRTPATSGRSCSTIVLLKRPITDTEHCGSNPVGERSLVVLGANAGATIITPPNSIKRTGPLSLQSDLESSGLRLYVYGWVEYSDIIAPGVHRTLFCGIYDPKEKRLGLCEKHNKLD
jgi:hypothetical protein